MAVTRCSWIGRGRIGYERMDRWPGDPQSDPDRGWPADTNQQRWTNRRTDRPVCTPNHRRETPGRSGLPLSRQSLLDLPIPRRSEHHDCRHHQLRGGAPGWLDLASWQLSFDQWTRNLERTRTHRPRYPGLRQTDQPQRAYPG